MAGIAGQAAKRGDNAGPLSLLVEVASPHKITPAISENYRLFQHVAGRSATGTIMTAVTVI